MATWNVNGLRARDSQFLEWLGRDRPRVVCLQEIKCKPEQLPAEVARRAGLLVVLARRRRLLGRRPARGARRSRPSGRSSLIRRSIMRRGSSPPISATCWSPRSTCPTAARTSPPSSPSSSALGEWSAAAAHRRPAAGAVRRPQRRAHRPRRASQGAEARSDRHPAGGAGAARVPDRRRPDGSSGARSIRTTTTSSPGGRRGATCASATSAGGSTTSWPPRRGGRRAPRPARSWRRSAPATMRRCSPTSAAEGRPRRRVAARWLCRAAPARIQAQLHIARATKALEEPRA